MILFQAPLLLLFLIAVGPIGAQTVEFIEPRHIQEIPEPEFTPIRTGKNFFILHKQYRMKAPLSFDLQLDAYNPSLKPVGSHRIDPVLAGEEPNLLEGISPMGDRLVMFKSNFTNSTKTFELFAYPFDNKGNRGEAVRLANYTVEKWTKTGSYFVQVSPDGSRIGVIKSHPSQKGARENGVVMMFDSTFTKLWERDYEWPVDDARLSDWNLFVGDNGSMYMMLKVDKKKQLPYHTLFAVGESGPVKEIRIDVGENMAISSFKALWSDYGDFMLTGFYFRDRQVGVNVGTPIGSFLLRVSANGTAETFTLAHEGVRELQLSDVKLLPNGSLMLVGEARSKTSTMIPNRPQESNNEYRNGDILVVKINTDGTLAWTSRVGREIRSMNDGGRTNTVFAHLHSGGGLSLVFKDYQYKHDGIQHKVVGPALANLMVNAVVQLDADGKVVKDTYINDPRMGSTRGEYYLLPATGFSISDNECFMYACRGKELVGVKVKF